MSEEEKIELAANTTDPEVLEKLSTDGSASVRRYVAEHPSCPPHVLEKPLSKDRNEYVRASVAGNKNCPPHVLEKTLSTDSFWVVRRSVAENENCPPHVLEEPLSKDKNEEVRKAVAEHPSCPPHVLEKPLSKDKNEYVREAVAGNKNSPLSALLRLFSEFKYDVKENPNYINCDASELLSYVNHEDFSVRAGVAANPKCPPQALINLCDDPNKEIREEAIDNPRAFDIPQIAEKLKAFNKKTINEYTKTKIPKNLNAPFHLHKSINTDLELLLALHKYLTKEN